MLKSRIFFQVMLPLDNSTEFLLMRTLQLTGEGWSEMPTNEGRKELLLAFGRWTVGCTLKPRLKAPP